MDEVLKEAWRRFGAFEKAGTVNQKRFLRVRRAILILGVLLPVLAILSTSHAPDWGFLKNHPRILHWTTFIFSLLLTMLLGVAARFDFGGAWVLSRHSAELIKREILLYRTRTGTYLGMEDVAAGERLAVELRALRKDAADSDRFGPSLDGDFPPPADGAGRIDAAAYQRDRVTDQIKWYRKRARTWRRWLVFFQLLIIVAGATGSVLAFVGDAATGWIAVTTAFTAAFAAWSEVRRLEPTALAYERAAAELSDVLLWWQALPAAERAASFDKLVAQVEEVIQAENASWTQDMRKRIAELRADAESRVRAAQPQPPAAGAPAIEGEGGAKAEE